MKQIRKFAILSALMATFAFVPPTHDIVGRWVTYTADGSMGYLNFDANGNFKLPSPDGQIFHQGKYQFRNDLFSINEQDGCGSTYWGKYKFNFVSEDSFVVALVEDSCTPGREQIMSGNLGLKRIKEN